MAQSSSKSEAILPWGPRTMISKLSWFRVNRMERLKWACSVANVASDSWYNIPLAIIESLPGTVFVLDFQPSPITATRDASCILHCEIAGATDSPEQLTCQRMKQVFQILTLTGCQGSLSKDVQSRRVRRSAISFRNHDRLQANSMKTGDVYDNDKRTMPGMSRKSLMGPTRGPYLSITRLDFKISNNILGPTRVYAVLR